MLQVYVSNISTVSNVYVTVFYLNVAYVALAIHVYYKCMFQLFQTYCQIYGLGVLALPVYMTIAKLSTQ
jgi:hypothetical protein